jgi:hypothetical protein
VLLGARALVLFLQLQLQRGGVQRFHVETAFVWFVLLAIVSVALRRGTSSEPEAAPTTFGRTPLTSLVVFWAAAVAVYFPALSVGFLSDDFLLLERAAHWQIGAVHAALFRPLPMLVWSILEAAGAPAAAYHLLNILLHGTNAFLSGFVVRGWVRRRWAGEVAAVLVLLAPPAVEAVAWCSGLFDVSMTTFALATLLIFRAREERKSSALLAAGIATAAAAILCKETGVVIPALLVCDAVARRSRAYLRDAGFRIVAVMAVAYAAVRVWLAVGATAPPVTKYVVQRTIFQAFGALADPWRADVGSAAPVLPVIFVAIITGILVRFVLVARSRQSLRVPIAACLWILPPSRRWAPSCGSRAICRPRVTCIWRQAPGPAFCVPSHGNRPTGPAGRGRSWHPRSARSSSSPRTRPGRTCDRGRRRRASVTVSLPRRGRTRRFSGASRSLLPPCRTPYAEPTCSGMASGRRCRGRLESPSARLSHRIARSGGTTPRSISSLAVRSDGRLPRRGRLPANPSPSDRHASSCAKLPP